ncbi:anti-sigma factor [Mesobacillus subterraneus]|uniref:anti-sigma factor family protein n=1 Tax=Mesobacillus subterraneus TaxID=285983 RepID=UPI00203F00F8|nr:anti-sigma factor [Mesobacillus subterraneus]MCM3666814.1 anti-sigma factor [Mesobacillus subterraneus]MCM3685708.1 anti-sigma factor [Mesobacillus subterraneus]
MNCPEQAIDYMHEYLDDEITEEHEKILREHLQSCSDCQEYFRELNKAIALVQSTSHIQAPDDFTSKVMAGLPKEKKKTEIQRWFRSHPLLTAASLFIALMTGSIFTTWNEEHQFSVSKQPNLLVENDTVIVPKGEVVKGDVVVRNGKVKIEGEVQGNVTVINGEKYLASAGNVTGEITEVNEVFEWIWYHIKKTAKNTANLFESEEKEQSFQ